MMDALGATIKHKEQPDYRRSAILRDQHGRRWATQVDKDTGDPCVAMTPTGWKAPYAMLVPPQKYLKTLPGEFGVIHIDYDQWILDHAEGAREYRDHLLMVARKEFGAAAMRAIDERDPKLKQLAGPPPGAVDFIRAMKAENKWALGMPRADGSPYPCPPWAIPMVDTLIPIETYGGTGTDTEVTVGEFPDVEDDTGEDARVIADRYADAETFEDIEDAIDPDALPTFQPLARKRGRPPKSL